MSILIAALSGSVNYGGGGNQFPPNLILNLDANDPISYSGTGSTWFDLSGQGHHATLINNPTFDNTGGINSIVLDGISQYIQGFDAGFFNNLTIEMWIQDQRSYTTDNQHDLLIYNSNGVIPASYTLSGPNQSPSPPFYPLNNFRTDGNGIIGRNINNVTIPLQNSWYRFCYTHNRDVWINDVKFTGGTGNDLSLSGPLLFGPSRDPSIARFQGKYSKIRVYNRILSDSEILQTFNSENSFYGVPKNFATSGLVTYLNPGDPNSYPGTGSTWYDLSGSNNHATLYGNPTYSNNEFVFNGTNYAQITDAASLHFGTDDITISLWAKGDFITNQNQGVLISKSEFLYELYLYNSFLAGWLGFPTYGIGIPNQLNNQQWYNFVLARRGNNFYLYVNKVLLGNSVAPVDLSGVGQDLTIARRPNGEFPFNGSIGQVALYNRALSDAEINQNFEAVKSQYGL